MTNDDSSKSNRRTLGLKIFSIALGLLLLLILVAALSTQSMTRANKRIIALVEYEIPLTQLVSRVEIYLLQQDAAWARLRRLQAVPSPAADIERERSLFEKDSAAAHEGIARALRLRSEAFQALQAEDELIEFARLEPMLSSLEKQHRQFREHVSRVHAKLQSGEREAAAALFEVVAEDRAGIDSSIDGIHQQLQSFIQMSSKNIERLERYVFRLTWIVTLIAITLGLVFAAAVTRGIVKPVLTLLNGTKEVERGNLEIRINARTRDEVGELTESFNHMVSELKSKERIKDTFGKYVDPRIVEGLIEHPDLLASEGERRVMTVLFCDMQGFTSLSEGMTPAGLVRLLNGYFEILSRPIREHKGIIDKYIGDAIMAFWGPPFTAEKEHARLACLTALEMQVQIGEFRKMLPDLTGLRKMLPDIKIRIGISTGEVVVGSIGSEFSKGYTVMGDTVNLASRLEGANKEYGSGILMAEQTWKMAADTIETRELDSVRVVGKSEPLRIFEPLGGKGGLYERQIASKTTFERGLTSYRSLDWDGAQDAFRACLEIDPGDLPAKAFLSRADHFRANPPGTDWDTVWSFTHK